ncbi:MAG: hypothetical protein PHN82_11110 [bacterium]|nr:hypothetical protein [bacterium]
MKTRATMRAAVAAAVLLLAAAHSGAQEERSFEGETGIDTPPPASAAAPAVASGAEAWVRAAKGRMEFSVANIFESRDIWRGIDWFVDNDPAYLLGGDFKLDLTPSDDDRRRDIWEVGLHSMVAGAYALKSGHENVDRWKVMAVLENRFLKYIDLDVGYEHYGLPPFDDRRRDFEELLIRAGFNAIPLFGEVSLPGYGEPVTAIPLGVHYGAYCAFGSTSFTPTTDEYGFHGYPNNWWWHNIEFNLLLPFPDAVGQSTAGVLRLLKLDSAIWIIDRPSVLPGLPSGMQDAEFGMALPLILDAGGWLGLDRRAWGVFGGSKIIIEPFLRYAIDAKNLDRKTGTWSDKDEIWGGVALVYAF